jgi:hypothetical protein
MPLTSKLNFFGKQIAPTIRIIINKLLDELNGALI